MKSHDDPAKRDPKEENEPPFHPTLALCLICKNESAYIEDCLKSVRGLVSEVIILDSGSSDDTKLKAQALKANFDRFVLEDRPWPQDFSDQRNAALERVQSSWVLFLDADERLDPSEHPKILKAIQDSEMQAYLIDILNYTNDFKELGFEKLPTSSSAQGYVRTQLHRLFRRSRLIRYEGRIHERIEPSLERHKLKTASLDVCIHHLGPLKEESHGLRKDRMNFYQKLAEQKVLEEPRNAQAHWELGVILQKQKNLVAAEQAFKKAYELEPLTHEFEVYYALSLFQQSKWADLMQLQAHSKKAQIFKLIAQAQEDPKKIEELDAYRQELTQVPMFIFELSLRHQRQDRLEKDRDLASKSLGDLGIVELIEGSYLLKMGRFFEAESLLKKSLAKKCLMAVPELLVCYGKSMNWKAISDLESSLGEGERWKLAPETHRAFEIARKLIGPQA